MKYRAILFDNDDTLMDFQSGNRRAVSQLMDELGYTDPDRYEQYEEMNLACWAELEKGLLTQRQVRLERFKRFFSLYPVQGDPAQAAARFACLLGRQSQLLPYAEDTVRRIAERLPVAIVTNGMAEIQRSRFAHSPLNSLVREMVISEEVGVSKPQPEIFAIALERLGVSPEDALMVGDSVSSDIRGANRAGVDACWFNPSGKALPEDVHAAYIIRDIRACVPIALQP